MGRASRFSSLDVRHCHKNPDIMQSSPWRPCKSRLDATRRNGRIDRCHPFDLGQFAGEKGLEVTETCRNHAHLAIPVARHQPAVNDLGELEDRALKCCQSVVDLLVQLHRHEDRDIKPSAASSTRTP